MSQQCHAVMVIGTYWDFCPSIAAAYTLLFLFCITVCVHIAQAFIHRKVYSWVIITSGILQVLTYIFRVLSIYNPANYGEYAAWFVLILIAPLWTNAYVYMVLGRMVWNFTKEAELGGIRPWNFGRIFICLDIIAFIIQVVGAAKAADAHAPEEVTLQGLHIYMGGVGAQQMFIVLFAAFAFMFHRKILQQGILRPTDGALQLLYAIYLILILITVRIIFRLVEYSSGLNSSIPNHEVYQYCLDSLPMLLASALLNIIHPGRVMTGKESDIPSRKVRSQKDLWRRNVFGSEPTTGVGVLLS